MKHLYLLRHAKSDWSQPHLSDFERTLNKRGERDAPEMGQRLLAHGVEFDSLISSPARRASLTSRSVAAEIDFPPESIRYEEEIYEASTNDLLLVIRKFDPRWSTVLLVGHNPGLTNLTNLLCNAGIGNLPTAGVAGIALSVSDWTEVSPSCGELTLYDYPKKTPEM